MSADQVCQDNVMAKINDARQDKKEHLKSSRTATLWLQYMDMVDILCKYKIYPGRAHRQLGIASPSCFRNASLLGSFWAQQLHKVCIAILRANVSSSRRSSIGVPALPRWSACDQKE